MSADTPPGSDRRRLLGNMASLFTLQGTSYILPLVTLPYLVRVLGPEKFGLITFAQAFIQYFVVATDYGFNLSATREVAVHRDNPQKLGEIISAVMVIKILLALAGAAILGALIWIVPTFHQHWLLYLVVYLTVAGATLFPTWLFQGLERMRDITWMNMTTRLLTTAAIFIFVHNPQDYVLAAAIQSLPVFLAAMPAWWVLRKVHSVPLQRPALHAMRKQIQGGWHVFLSTAAINVYTSSNTFVLGIIAGPTAVGYFSAAIKIIAAAYGLFTPINQALYPHISRLSQYKAIQFIKTTTPYYISIGMIVSILFFLFRGAIINIVLGPDYHESLGIMAILSTLPAILSVGYLYGSLTILALGENIIFSRITIFSALINISLTVPLTYLYQGSGTAISIVITELLASVLFAFAALKKIKTPNKKEATL